MTLDELRAALERDGVQVLGGQFMMALDGEVSLASGGTAAILTCPRGVFEYSAHELRLAYKQFTKDRRRARNHA